MDKFIIAILPTVLTLALAIVQSILVRKVNSSITQREEDARLAKESSEALKSGVMALLGDSIDRLCRKALLETDLNALASDVEKIEHLNKPYMALHGNGVIKQEISSVHAYYRDALKASSQSDV